MPYCSNCGNQLREGAKFCDSCGKPVTSVDDGSKRQTVFEGKIHKCPNCGEVIEAFQDDCPSCGYKFRDVKVTSSVKELADKLENISNQNISASEKASMQYSLISSFAIPNTREDLWEFLIISSSNIQQNSGISQKQAPAQIALQNAWMAKFEQAYQKSKLVIDNPSEIKKINKLYDSKSSQFKRAKNSKIFKMLALVTLCLSPFLFLIVFFTSGGLAYEHNVKKENNRLNSIVEEVYDCIDNENYTLARVKAANVSFNYSSDWSSDYEAIAENWDEIRENLFKIIDEAEQESKKQTNTGGE